MPRVRRPAPVTG